MRTYTPLTLDAPLVAYDELVAPVDEVRMRGAEPVVVREEDLRVVPARYMLGALQEVAEPVDALIAADQDETRLARRLHRAEVLGLQVLDLGRNGRSARAAELVTGRHRGRALLAHVVTRLIHQLLLRELGHHH
jgi:hypothetical protein